MEIVRKLRKLEDIEFGSVVLLNLANDTSTTKERLYMVCDDCCIVNSISFPKGTSADYVMCTNLTNGAIDYFEKDLEVEVIPTQLVADY